MVDAGLGKVLPIRMDRMDNVCWLRNLDGERERESCQLATTSRPSPALPWLFYTLH